MALSRDPRKPTRFMRGSKRTNDVGGHSPPGDELENTRDHERIWFELRRTRSCCDCESPGFKYCFETFDWPSYICNGDFPGGDSLFGYWPGKGGIWGLGGWQVEGACGADALHSEIQNSMATFFPSGSWRDGPYYEKQFFGNNLDLAVDWGNFFPNVPWTFEAWLRPNSANLDNGDEIIGYGSFATITTGGIGVRYQSDGGVTLYHKEIGDGDPQQSNPGWFEADQWHHFVLRRDTVNKTIAVFVNGKLAISRVLPTTGWVASGGEFAINRGDWSDLAYYQSALSAKVIRQHFQAVYGVEGVPNPLTDEQGNIDDPSDVITSQITIDIIDGGGAGQVGYIPVSQGDVTSWMSPEDSPFELEARKGQVDGYAELDGSGLLPLSRIGTAGTPSLTSFLRGDRTWKEGQVVPPPTALDEMLVSGPDVSTEFVTQQLLVPGLTSYYKLNEPAAPFQNTGASAPLSTVVGTPAVASTVPLLFSAETYLQMDEGDGIRGYPSGGVDQNSFGMSGWVFIDALPASGRKNLFAYGDHFNNGPWIGLALRSDGKLTIDRAGTEKGLTTATLEPGRWYHLAFVFRPSGGSPKRQIAIDGVVVLDESTDGFGTLGVGGGLKIGGSDGYAGGAGHVALYNGPTGISALIAPYVNRTYVWTPSALSAGGGVSGIEVSAEDVDVTADPRPRLNFKAGSNVALTVADDPGGDEVEVTIAATAPAGSGIEVSDNGADVSASPRGRLNFLDGAGTTVVTADDGVNDEVEVQIDVDHPLPDPSGQVDGDVLTIDSGAWVVAAPPAGGGGGGVEVDLNDVDATAAARGRLNFIEGTGIDITVSDDGANNEVDITIAATGGGGGGSYDVEPALQPPSSAHAKDDEFNGSSLDPKWSWDNQGGVTAQVAMGKLLLTAPTGSGTQLRSIRQVAPTGDFTVVARLAVGQRPVDFHMASLFVANSANGKASGIGFQTFNVDFVRGVDNWNSASSYSARSGQESRRFDAGWVRIQKVGTNLTFSYSPDGIAWVVQHTIAIASFLGAVDRIGVGITNNNGTYATTASFDFFRVTEP